MKGHWKDTCSSETHFHPQEIYIVQKKKQYEPEVKGIESGDVIRGAEKEGLLLFDKKLDMTKLMKVYYVGHDNQVKKNFKIKGGYFEKRERWRRMYKRRKGKE